MKNFFEMLGFFQDSGLFLTSFIIGALAIIMAIVGRYNTKDGVSLTVDRSMMLGIFGFFLVLFAFSGSLAASPTNPPAASSITRARIDAILGEDNWFCFPDRDDGLGVKRIPQGFSVVPPFRLAATYQGEFAHGDFVPAIGATLELDGSLPRADCPVNQKSALEDWKSARALDQSPLTGARLDNILGKGNWQCNEKFSFAVDVNSLLDNLSVAYPITFVTHYESSGYGVGESVPAGNSATVWLSGSIPQEECPQELSFDGCIGSDWESCWLFNDTTKTMTWAGPTSGTFDIGQRGETLEKIRAGYSAIFNVDSSAFIETCEGTINGRAFSGACPVMEHLPPGQYEVVSSGEAGGFRVRSREPRLTALHQYDAIYNQEGWCALWDQLTNDGLVKGYCPHTIGDVAQETIDDAPGTSEEIVTGLQLTLGSDVEVIYPACVNYGINGDYANIFGGQVQTWTENSHIATNVPVLGSSVFTLYFRCDHLDWDTVLIPGYQETGVEFSVMETGTHRITIEAGAYSPWPSDNYHGYQGWLSQIYIYRNRPVAWGLRESGLVGPVKPDYVVGSANLEITQAVAEAVAQDMSITAVLEAGDILTFVPIDEKYAYTSPTNNRGEVIISVIRN